MRLTAVRVRDFKGVKDVALEPDDHGLMVIGGANDAGKSSVIDALTWAFGGPKKATKGLVRRGADGAEVVCEIDGGSIVVTRRQSADGKKSLRVVNADGHALHSAQAALDKLIGERALDPLEFLRLKPAKQREQLLHSIGLGDELDRLAEQRTLAYASRRDAGTRLKAAEPRLQDAPPPGPRPPDPPPVVDVSALRAKLDEARRVEYDRERLQGQLDNAKDFLVADERRVEDLRQQFVEAERALETRRHDVASRQTAIAAIVIPDTFGAEMEIAQADGVASDREAAIRVIADWQAAANTHAERAAEVDAARAARAAAQAQMDEIDARKAAAIEAADLPIPGLDVSSSGVLYDGTPLEDCSGSRRLRISLAIAAALKPDLRAVWCKGGEALDARSLADVEQFALDRDLLVIVERVGLGDSGAIIIEDGRVRS